MKVGIIGCGNISQIYFTNSKKLSAIDLVACSDLDMEKAQGKAEEHEVEAITLEEMYSHSEIQLIINLTIPAAHYEVGKHCLENGKHVYSEKPFTMTVFEAKELNDLAKSKGLRIGSAPDTFLGGSHQACRRIIEDGYLGTITNGFAFMTCGGHESWHPAPEFYYQPGGGPLWDMGPYYITALINMLGPVKTVQAIGNIAQQHRTCTSESRHGDTIEVNVTTHYTANLQFANDAVITLITSFDVVAGPKLPNIVLNGTEASLQIPDPNGFGGEIKLGNRETGQQTYPVLYKNCDNARALGVADMADAIENNRPHRCSAELVTHVVEVMESIDKAVETATLIKLETTCKQPAIMPVTKLNGSFE